ncbi:hypothetical protein MHYP_G00156830 [Metynnis hypsauchen]
MELQLEGKASRCEEDESCVVLCWGASLILHWVCHPHPQLAHTAVPLRWFTEPVQDDEPSLRAQSSGMHPHRGYARGAGGHPPKLWKPDSGKADTLACFTRILVCHWGSAPLPLFQGPFDRGRLSVCRGPQEPDMLLNGGLTRVSHHYTPQSSPPTRC